MRDGPEPSRSAAGKRALWTASVKVGDQVVSVTVFHLGGDDYELSSPGREPHRFHLDRPITAAIAWNEIEKTFAGTDVQMWPA
jgi:hypothetical protein